MTFKNPKDIANDFPGYEGAVETAICFDREAIATTLEKELHNTIENGHGDQYAAGQKDTLRRIVICLRAHQVAQVRKKAIGDFVDFCKQSRARVDSVFTLLSVCGSVKSSKEIYVSLGMYPPWGIKDVDWISDFLALAKSCGVLGHDNSMAYKDRLSFARNGAESWVRNKLECLEMAR